MFMKYPNKHEIVFLKCSLVEYVVGVLRLVSFKNKLFAGFGSRLMRRLSSSHTSSMGFTYELYTLVFSQDI